MDKPADYKEIDFIFLAISAHPRITREELITEYQNEREALNITEGLLDDILERLLSDKYIFNSGTGFEISVDGKNFLGYTEKYIEGSLKETKADRRDLRFKRYSIAISVVFGILTVIFALLNYLNTIKLNKSNVVIAQQKKTIDSLRTFATPKDVGRNFHSTPHSVLINPKAIKHSGS